MKTILAIAFTLFISVANAETYQYTGNTISPYGGVVTASVWVDGVNGTFDARNRTSMHWGGLPIDFGWTITGSITVANGLITAWSMQGIIGGGLQGVWVLTKTDGDFVWSADRFFGQAGTGTWTVPVIQNPIPPALPLFAGGLALIYFVRGRRIKT